MKIFTIVSLFLSGGTALVMQNEEVASSIDQTVSYVKEYVDMHRHVDLDTDIVENGLPYPPSTWLAQLTEEQQAAIIAAIDGYNATYDWSLLTEEELATTLATIRTEMDALFVELGIDVTLFHTHPDRDMDCYNDVIENGVAYPSDTVLALLTEEQALTVTTLIDTYNATYDWATLTDDEIAVALDALKAELDALEVEYGVDFSTRPVHADYASLKLDAIRETGLVYPSDTVLALLTEEQALTVTTLIDTYNATYDWATLTDDELEAALDAFDVELDALEAEFGVNLDGHHDDSNHGDFEGHNDHHDRGGHRH